MSIPDALRPARYGESLRERPRWAAAFIAVSLLYIMLGLVSAGDRADLTARRLPPSATPDARAAAGAMLGDATVIRSLFLPVRLFAGWSVYGLALLYACRIWKSQSGIRFAQVFGAAVYSEFVLFLGGAAAACAAASSVPGGGPAPPWVPGGLDLLVATGDFTARYVLNSINVFSIVYIAILAVTLAGATGLPRAKAAVSAVIAWAAAISVNASIIHALRTEFQFHL